MAEAAEALAQADAEPPPVLHCGACDEPMVTSEGKTRLLRECAHSCSACKKVQHAPMVCEKVWFPVVDSNCRTFCNEKCLREWNEVLHTYPDEVYPIRQRQPADDGDDNSDVWTALANTVAVNNSSGTEPLPHDCDEIEPAPESAAAEMAAVSSLGAAVPTAASDENSAQQPSAEPAAAAEPPVGQTGDEGGVGAAMPPGESTAAAPAVAKPAEPALGSVGGSDGKSSKSTAPKALPFNAGERVRMNFNPGRASHPSWYGGKFVVASATEFYIAFDDGDLRAFGVRDVKDSVEIGTIEKIADEPHGLVDNSPVEYKAEEVTQFKEGRMVSPKICGVLVGKHEHGIGSTPAYVAHHVCIQSFESDFSSRGRPRRSLSKAQQAGDRKGFHTFACGDKVQCNAGGDIGIAEAIVFGVAIYSQNNQMRRALILYDDAGAASSAQTAGQFFVSTWAQWTRCKLASVSEVEFDCDDDDMVEAAPADDIARIMQAWKSDNPLKKIATKAQLTHHASKNGLPPSAIAKPKPPAPKAPVPSGKGGAGKGKGTVKGSQQPSVSPVPPSDLPQALPTPIMSTPMPTRVPPVDRRQAFHPLPEAVPITELTAELDEDNADLLRELEKAKQAAAARNAARNARRAALRAEIAAQNRLFCDDDAGTLPHPAASDSAATRTVPPVAQPAQPAAQQEYHQQPMHMLEPNASAHATHHGALPYTPTHFYGHAMHPPHASTQVEAPTPESERALKRNISVLQAEQTMTVSPRRNAQLAGMIAGFTHDLSNRRRLRSIAMRQPPQRYHF